MSCLRLMGRTLGELLITLGVLLALFTVWQLWWTDVQANAAAEDVLASMEQEYSSAAPITPDPSGAPTPTAPSDAEDYPKGAGMAIVHLPTIGEVRPVLNGVDSSVLNQGAFGHYEYSAGPGEIGNFALAGHRTTYGRPLWDLDELKPGDPIVVETRRGYYIYTFKRHRLVLPDQVEVTAPVPDHPDATPTEAWMVLTACHPKFSAWERLIGYARLKEFVPRADGPPAELSGGSTPAPSKGRGR